MRKFQQLHKKPVNDEKETQNFIKIKYKVRQINRESEYRNDKSHSEVPPSILSVLQIL